MNNKPQIPDNRQPKQVSFYRSHVLYLEHLYGTWSEVGQCVGSATPEELARRAGQQDVLDTIRKMVSVL